MFGPEHPRASGFAGTQGERDAALPGFGAFGTAGAHVFDRAHPAFARIKALITARKTLRPLRRGRQYRRATSIGGDDFHFQGPGELLAWSRILNDVEVLIAVNTNGIAGRGLAHRARSAPPPRGLHAAGGVRYEQDRRPHR